MSERNNNSKLHSRRSLLKCTALSTGSLLLNSCSTSSKKVDKKMETGSSGNSTTASNETTSKVIQKKSTPNEDIGPIERGFGEVAPFQYSGDNPELSHQILWDVAGFQSKQGATTNSQTDTKETVPLVIVGGGLSGLLTAYRLKKYVSIVLEGAERFGGNAKGESWRGMDYSIGGTEFRLPLEGSSLDGLYKELDLYQNEKKITDENITQLKNKIYLHFLMGDTDTSVATQAAQLEQYFSEINENKNGRVYPQLPPVTPEQKKAVNELDGYSFRDYLKKILETDTLHPHLDTWIEHFCWMTFGGSAREISAAMGVNQMSSLLGKSFTIPGGLAQLSEQLYLKVKKAIGADRLRARAVVYQVQIVNDGVLVSYFQDGESKSILAESVVMACGKNVVKKIFPALSAESEKVIRRIRYNGCLVANLFLKQKLPQHFYKLNLLNEGKLDPKDVQGNAERDRATMLVNASYAKSNSKKEETILTLYRPFPYAAGKAQIYSTTSYFKFRKEFIDQVENSILPSLGIPTTAVVGLRIARWGHSFPVPQAGMINGGELEKIQEPIQEKVYFINQDNWLNPCVESIFGEVERWTPQIEKSILERREKKLKQDAPHQEVKSPNPVNSKKK